MKTTLRHFLILLILTSATAALAADKTYPLKSCIVSGNTLGSMGKIVVKSHEGQEIKFCCKPCVKKFDANPAKYMAKLKK